jgi:hypothetical protein
METPEYTRILSRVDAQLEEARIAWEEKARKVQLENKLKLIDHQTGELLKREEAFARFGAPVPPELAQAIERLRSERALVEGGLNPKPPSVASGPIMIPVGDVEEMRLLLQEVVETEMALMDPEEKYAQLEVWALRWRILSDRISPAAVQQSSVHKKTYRFIREKMDETSCGYLGCLNPEEIGDWAARLKEVQKTLTRLAVYRAEKSHVDDLPGEALGELFLFLGASSPEGNSEEEWLRTLKHLVRQAARFPHMRDEVAHEVEPYRGVLEPEFAFLWKNGKEHPELSGDESQKLSNRDILGRLLRRLRGKGLIGGSHGPYEGIVNNGFPGHDLERAKRAMDLLIKAGVVKAKPTNYGVRISMEPKAVSRVDDFLNGQPMGYVLVDEFAN